MPTLFFRAFFKLTFLTTALALLSSLSLHADLVWTPSTGWRVEGGVLEGVLPEEGRSALDSMNKARADEEKGKRSSAMKRYESVAKKYPNSIYAAEALYRSAGLRAERRQFTKAYTAYQSVLTRYPNSPHFTEIIGAPYQIANALLEGKRPLYFGVIPGFKNRAKGIEYFEGIVTSAPYSDYAPLALMNVARGHRKLDDPDAAIDALDRMINNYQQSLLAPDAYFKLAETHASLVKGPYYDQASTRQAITYFEDFLILFPTDANVPAVDKSLVDARTTFAQSKIKIGDFYFYKRDNFKAARVFYNEAITSYPDSAAAEEARKRLAEVERVETKAATPETPRPKPKRSFWLF
jgi:outer membrane protein assembly factor BamD